MAKPEPVPGIEQTTKCDTWRNGITWEFLFKYRTIEPAETRRCPHPQETTGILVNGVGKFITQTFSQTKIKKLVRLG